MCYIQGSVLQATSTCPMCKVFRPSSSRCPHIKDTCYNRASHPQYDIVYIRNAEVPTFAGCGFCKWAANPPSSPKTSGSHNSGWPGCCRAPTSTETRCIPAADWPAVSVVHHIPIPQDIKTLLELVKRGSPTPYTQSGSKNSPPATERKGSAKDVTPPKASSSVRTPPMNIPSRGRSGGSPKEGPTGLSSSMSRITGSHTGSSPKTLSPMDQRESQRHSDRRGDSSHPSPGSKALELESPLARRNSARRQTIQPATFNKPTSDDPNHPPLRRRASTTNTNAMASTPSTPPARPTDLQPATIATHRRTHAKKSSIEEVFSSIKISTPPPLKAGSRTGSESGGSLSSGELSESTVTSEGFTDYLSDESEAELQRQAEAKAAQQAQNTAEEMEFKVARQQLVGVDLRPPKSWNPTASAPGTPRAQAQSAGHDSSYLTYGPAAHATPPARSQVDVGTYSRR